MTRLRLLAMLSVTALVAASCGGGSDADTADSAPAETKVAAATTDTSDAEESPSAPAEPTPDIDEQAGGTADGGLVEALGLPPCPAGAHLDADGPVEIELWHPYSALTAEAMQDLGARFNASQDDIVVTVEAQGDYGELLAKYRESIGFGDLPAVMISDSQAFREMVDSETVLPAQSCVEADGFELDTIDAALRASVSIDGALYPAGLLVSTPVLYYNRDHFEAAGLDPDAPPTTLSEIQSAAEALAGAGVAETPLSLVMSGWFVETWLYGAGVQIVNRNNGRDGIADQATFNGPEALEIYTVLDQMNDDGLIVAFSNTPGQVGQYLAGTGPASMILETSTAATTVAGVLGGTANLSELVEAAGVDGDIVGATDLSINIDVAPFPGLREPGRIFASGGNFYMTNTGSDAEQAAAWEFMKFVNELEQQKIIHLKGSYLPVGDFVLNDPEVEAVWERDSAGQWLATAYAQLADIDPAQPAPAVGPFTEQREAFEQALEAVILGGVEAGDALAEAENRINEALEDYAEADF